MKKITEKNLEKIHYGSMKREFEKLGIGSAWSYGEKKKILIKRAVEALAKKETDKIIKEEKPAPKFSLEVIEKNLKNIDANLKNNVKTQREVLLKKKKELLKMKEQYEKLS